MLDVALDLGDYETPGEPRTGTSRGGWPPVGTVAEHLRTIEARVFGSLVG